MNWTLEDVEHHQARLKSCLNRANFAKQQTQNTESAPLETYEALESQLQSKIEAYLKGLGWLFWHDRSRGENVPGLPDLIIWGPGGRHILMELKRKGGKMSDDQRRFKARVLFLGHEYHEIRSLKQAVAVLSDPRCNLCGRRSGEGPESVPCPACGIGIG